MITGSIAFLEIITPSMKTAIVILYVIAIVQAFGTLVGFAFAYDVLQSAFYEAGKSIGENLIKICDQRYVQK